TFDVRCSKSLRDAPGISLPEKKQDNIPDKHKYTMKLTHTRKTTRKAGMTLLELTVVILVLLSLIAVLFVGARALKRGSDRATFIMNIRIFRQAMRGDMNMRDQNPGTGTGLAKAIIVGPTGFVETGPRCAGDNSLYDYLPDG